MLFLAAGICTAYSCSVEEYSIKDVHLLHVRNHCGAFPISCSLFSILAHFIQDYKPKQFQMENRVNVKELQLANTSAHLHHLPE